MDRDQQAKRETGQPAGPDRLVVRHPGSVSAGDRQQLLGQRGGVVWFTGLSGSGKSTLAHALEKRLMEGGRLAFVLDGDNVRHGLNRDLGFTAEDRVENIRRIGEVAALFADAGLIALVAFISPFHEDRVRARQATGAERFLEVFVDAPLEVCEQRDPKGLYRKARSGELREFTGVSSPYERPQSADLVIDTASTSVAQAVVMILDQLVTLGLISSAPQPGDQTGGQ